MPSAGFEPAISAIKRPQNLYLRAHGHRDQKIHWHKKVKKKREVELSLETWTGPEVSRSLRLPYSMTLGTRRW